MALIGDRLPSALMAWLPHRRAQPESTPVKRRSAASADAICQPAGAAPHGLLDVATETQRVLTDTTDFARSRFVELQMAVTPRLTIQADSTEYQACLRHLVLGAIMRASGGVLVTAIQQGGSVEIAVLDDGMPGPGAQPGGGPWTTGSATPLGGTTSLDHEPGRGTTVRLRLPQPDWPDLLAQR